MVVQLLTESTLTCFDPLVIEYDLGLVQLSCKIKPCRLYGLYDLVDTLSLLYYLLWAQ